jgi:hypothetical protein
MGFYASDLGSVPGLNKYQWYVFLLEDNYSDAVRQELDKNWPSFSIDAGKQTLVVRGSNRTSFYDEVFETYGLRDKTAGRELCPGLLITDTHPTQTDKGRRGLKEARMILLSLSQSDKSREPLVSLLRKVTSALKDPEALKALQDLSPTPTKLEKYWSWLGEYVGLKPVFLVSVPTSTKRSRISSSVSDNTGPAGGLLDCPATRSTSPPRCLEPPGRGGS